MAAFPAAPPLRTLEVTIAVGNAVFLGHNVDNYNVRYLTVTVTYSPAVLRGGRSAM